MVINTVRIHISCILYALQMDLPYLTKEKDQLSEATKKIAPRVRQAYKKDKWEETLEAQDQTTMKMEASVYQDLIRNKDHSVRLDIKDYDH